MNVYSVRLLPSLKIKLCQFLGIATSMAIDELGLRLESLERKLDRLDVQLRRSSNRAMPILEGRVGAKTVKKKPSPARKATTSTPPKKKLADLKSLPRPVEEETIESLIPAVVEVVEAVATIEEATPLRREALLLMQADENTRRSAIEYFGSEVEILEVETLGDVAAAFDSHQVLAMLFDRGQLGQADFRGTLEILAQSHPETRMIGLSSYLTLALADSLPQREDFATFLTRPLSAQSLAEVFGGSQRQAIS